MDIFIAVITVPTLILLALLLDANIQDTFDSTSLESRSPFIVLLFGFGFLVLSLLVCGCIAHKMGVCLWNQERYEEEQLNACRLNGAADGVHVIDLPPSYEAVTRNHSKPDESIRCSVAAKPPPSYEMACKIESSLPNAINHI